MKDEDIDTRLLRNVGSDWRKVARVVGMTMIQIDPEARRGQDDLYFAGRIISLIERGFVEASGEVIHLRETEIRIRETEIRQKRTG
ncbi:MAG: hypothetical protein KF756_11580 [Acidobacteria bacterium]|nr:hypothetical protein [Acidobacteriota bacterium]